MSLFCLLGRLDLHRSEILNDDLGAETAIHRVFVDFIVGAFGAGCLFARAHHFGLAHQILLLFPRLSARNLQIVCVVPSASARSRQEFLDLGWIFQDDPGRPLPTFRLGCHDLFRLELTRLKGVFKDVRRCFLQARRREANQLLALLSEDGVWVRCGCLRIFYVGILQEVIRRGYHFLEDHFAELGALVAIFFTGPVREELWVLRRLRRREQSKVLVVRAC